MRECGACRPFLDLYQHATSSWTGREPRFSRTKAPVWVDSPVEHGHQKTRSRAIEAHDDSAVSWYYVSTTVSNFRRIVCPILPHHHHIKWTPFLGQMRSILLQRSVFLFGARLFNRLPLGPASNLQTAAMKCRSVRHYSKK